MPINLPMGGWENYREVLDQSREAVKKNPTVKALVECHKGNPLAQSMDDIVENPPVRGVYRDGFVIADVQSQYGFMGSATRKLGCFSHFEPFRPDDDFTMFHVGYTYTGGPRKTRFEARVRLKEAMGSKRVLITLARRLTFKDFLNQLSQDDRLALKDVGFASPEHFYHAARSSTLPDFLKIVQSKIDTYACSK